MTAILSIEQTAKDCEVVLFSWIEGIERSRDRFKISPDHRTVLLWEAAGLLHPLISARQLGE
jgi:hypothetical protein